MKKFISRILIFTFPVILIWLGTEIMLRKVDYAVSKKAVYFENHKSEIKILALGSSHFERGINPMFLDWPTLNLGNSGQRINENYDLYKHFIKQLPQLKLVIVELSYDWLERDKSLTPAIIDHENLIYYDTNTFDRRVMPWDYSLYLSDSDYYSKILLDKLKGKTESRYNSFGFDTLRYFGYYQSVGYKNEKIEDQEIFVQNAEDSAQFQKNVQVFKNLIKDCRNRGISVLVFNTPNHFRYNELRDPEIVSRRDSLENALLSEFAGLKILDLENNTDFTAKYFYNADHLNPKGAEKATRILNEYISEHFSMTK